MADIIGTLESDRLFGTDGSDVIRGFGGNDLIQGNAGADLISGTGQIDTGNGGDSYFSVRAMFGGWLTDNFFTDVTMGRGNDLAVMTDHDPKNGITNYGFGLDIDMGGGKDKIIYGAKPFADVQSLGQGADKAFILSDSIGGGGSGGVRLSLGGDGTFGINNDAQRDVVHLDTNTPVTTLYQFGDNDRIILYGMDASVEDLRLRTTFIHNDQSSLIVTFENGNTLEVVKGWQGYLDADRLTIVERELSVREQVLLQDEDTLRDALFLSGADNSVKAKNHVVFAGAGDDAVFGNKSDDILYGDGGDDRLVGRQGQDVLDGGMGDDRLIGGSGSDRIYTGAGNDTVKAGGGNDEIIIGRGGGYINGGSGNDRFELSDSLVSSDPDLKLRGGGGADIFAIEGYSWFPAVQVMDFDIGRDLIELNKQDGWTAVDEESFLANMLARVGTLDRSSGDPFDGAYIRYGGLNVDLRGIGPDTLTADDFIFG